MRSLCLALIGMLMATAIALARSAPPSQGIVIRQGANPADGAVIGQRVTLYVEVLFAGTMPRPPRVSLPDVPGLQTFRFESQATTMRDRIDGADYVGQRFEFAVYARRGGTFTVPGATVTLLDPSGNPVGTAAGTPTTLTIRVPSGVDPSVPVIASTAVRMSETWSQPANTTFKVGDAIKRTIHREAEDVPALAMQPVPAAAPDGVRAYVEPPLGQDSIARGSLTGRRTDTITYVFEKAGNYALPAITQNWWDLRDASPKQATAAGITISAAAVPNAGAPPRAFDPRKITAREIGIVLAGLGLAILLIWLTWRLAPLLIAAWRGAWQRRADSEEVAFRTLLRAAKSGNPADTYRAYLVWRSRLPETDRVAVAGAVSDLETRLYGARPQSEPWSKRDGHSLASRLRQVRRSLRHRRLIHRETSSLPPLNPVSFP